MSDKWQIIATAIGVGVGVLAVVGMFVAIMIFQFQLLNDVGDVKARIAVVEYQVGQLRGEVTEVKSDIEGLREDISKGMTTNSTVVDGVLPLQASSKTRQ